jgi:hypothetical protein
LEKEYSSILQFHEKFKPTSKVDPYGHSDLLTCHKGSQSAFLESKSHFIMKNKIITLKKMENERIKPIKYVIKSRGRVSDWQSCGVIGK